MEDRSKPTAAVLAFALLVAPAAALASCSQAIPAMAGMGMPGMIMPVGEVFSGVSLSRCCVDSPAEIATSLLRTNEEPAILASAAHLPNSWRPMMPLIPDRVFRASSPPGQALLCVFLI